MLGKNDKKPSVKTLFILALLISLVFAITKVILSRSKDTKSNMSQNNMKLGKNTSMGRVTLFVKDLDVVTDFYGDKIGLKVIEKSSDSISLGFNDVQVIRLIKKDLLKAAYGSAGLYHTAILFPNKETLATSLKNVLQKAPQYFEGSSDHAVSQAFYFHDPEGNGVELYVDRPRSEWKWQDGRVQMGSQYIDPVAFINENLKNQSIQMDAKVGHVHLRVGDIAQANEFYVDTLGFDITAQLPEENPSALFVSAGEYHHHLGLNTWESKSAPKRTPSLGLGEFEIKLESKEELSNLIQRLSDNKVEYNNSDSKLIINDPWDNKIIFLIQN